MTRLNVVLLIAVIVGVTLTYKRFDDFVSATTGHHLNPIGEVVQVVEPAQGTLAYKLKHGQPVNILLLRLPDGTEQVKVLDFGIAKMKEGSLEHTSYTPTQTARSQRASLPGLPGSHRGSSPAPTREGEERRRRRPGKARGS